ncbi:MAG: amino acid ABC transporter permease [Desulfobacterota bacterium]|jgi:general L-amino acid transport system permease protein|nr:amino acid ABC transporter permease [Thermodesulfobacteriota bacterium]
METLNKTIDTHEMKPPATRAGGIGWARENLFSGPVNSFLTVVTLLVLYKTVPLFTKWAFIDSVWFTPSEGCKTCVGACWSIVTQNLRFILFGFYPYELQWRPFLSLILFVALILYSSKRTHWKQSLFYVWAAALVAIGVLMKGGIFGLTAVETTQWSGLPITLLLSVFTMVVAYPLGVMIALCRRSKLPIIKALSIVYIEVIRGVPLISLLFMSAIMFPLFMPEGVTVDKLIRASVALIMFTSAYIAEVVRGGLQGMSKGQYEAAESLGLNYFQTMRLVILPQALKMVIPPTVGILVAAFKDTSLLVIIAVYDLLKTTQTVLSDPLWMGFSAEAYLFISIFYFAGCFSLSSFSRKLEKELQR